MCKEPLSQQLTAYDSLHPANTFFLLYVPTGTATPSLSSAPVKTIATASLPAAARIYHRLIRVARTERSSMLNGALARTLSGRRATQRARSSNLVPARRTRGGVIMTLTAMVNALRARPLAVSERKLMGAQARPAKRVLLVLFFFSLSFGFLWNVKIFLFKDC